MKFSDQFEERCEDWEGLVVVLTKSGWVWTIPSDDDSDEEEEDKDGYDDGVGSAADQTTPSDDGNGVGGDESVIMMILVVMMADLKFVATVATGGRVKFLSAV